MRRAPLKPHPLAGLLPMMTEAEFASFKADVAINKQIDPAKSFDGMLLDGRHRQRACDELGIDFDVEPFEGTYEQAFAYVCSKAHHRHLTDSQKACAAAKFNAALQADRASGRIAATGKSRDRAVTLFGVSAGYVQHATKLLETSPDAFADVFDGKLKLTAALTRARHKSVKTHVEKLRRASGVGMDHCDLRHGDNLDVMRALPAGSAATVFADPPYNCGWTYRDDKGGDKLRDTIYLPLTQAWMHEAARLLKPDGSLFVLIDDRYSDFYGTLLRECGLVRRPTIVLVETFAQYNSTETGLSRNARYLHWYAKTDKPLINTVEARIASDRNSKYADPRGVEHGRLPGNVWEFTRVTSQAAERCPWLGQPGEAPQLPRSLPERCILLTSLPGDLIVDPFNGNGITGIAAISNQRRYIGVDRDKKGLEQSRDWIAHEVARLSTTPEAK